MNIMLISRESATALRSILADDENLWLNLCVNDLMEAYFYWRCYHEMLDIIVLIEGELTNEDMENYLKYLKKMSANKAGKKIIYITRNPDYYELIQNQDFPNLDLYLVEDLHISPVLIKNLLDKEVIMQRNKKGKEGKFFSFAKKDSSDFEALAKQIRSHLQHGHKIIVFTGHAGSGITGSAANIAYQASLMGIKTYLLDLDVEARGMNLYFNKFGEEADTRKELADSAFQALAKPERFEEISCRINENLFVSTCAYSYMTGRKEETLLEDTRKIAFALGRLKEQAQLVIVDAPFRKNERLEILTLYADVLAICVANNLYSLIGFTNQIAGIKPEPLFFKKSKLILSKFNLRNTYKGKAFSPEKACELLGLMNRNLEISLQPAGLIPAVEEFVLQIDTGKKITAMHEEFKKHYVEILSELIV